MAKNELFANYSFLLECDGIAVAYFKSVSGLDSEVEVIEHRQTSKGRERVEKVPGQRKWGDVTFKRGMTDDMSLWEWHDKAASGKVREARKNGSIIVYDQGREEIARWNFENAWPCKISGPQLEAGSNEIAVETVTLTHEGIKRVK